MALTYSLSMYVDWNDDGDYLDANEDVSADLFSVGTRRGRASLNDDYKAGEINFKLRNLSGTYAPFNSGSALSGLIYPGRPLKFVCTVNGTDYDVFTGTLGDIGQPSRVGDLPAVQFGGYDAFESMGRKKNVRIDLQENKRVDELITAVLDTYGWSASARDLDVATQTIDQFWIHRDTAMNALRQATKQELGSLLFMDRSGNVVFRNKHWRGGRTSAFTTTGGQMFNLGLRREDFVDSVSYSRAGLDVDTATTVLFTLSPTGRRMAPGTASALNTLNGAYAVAGKSVVTPVATTDYVFNSAADGTGTDKTAQVTVDTFTSFGGGFQIIFNNLDSSDVYLTSFQVRGQAVRRSNDERRIEVSVPSPVATGESISDTFDFNDDADQIESYARFTGAVANTLQPRPVMVVTPPDNATLEAYLQLELGDVIHVTNSNVDEGLYVDSDFSVEGISWSFDVGSLPRVQLQLLNRDYVRGKLFRISGASLYSTISGTDRIGW